MTFEQALGRAENLCAKQEKCTFDIRVKLEKWGIPEDEKEKIIQRLSRNRFLDDERFAVLFARDKQKFNKWGREKIRFELRKKGIGADIIESAISGIAGDISISILRDLLVKKKKEIKYSSLYEMKGKLAKYGIQKGYSYDEVYMLVEELCK